ADYKIMAAGGEGEYERKPRNDFENDKAHGTKKGGVLRRGRMGQQARQNTNDREVSKQHLFPQREALKNFGARGIVVADREITFFLNRINLRGRRRQRHGISAPGSDESIIGLPGKRR